MAWAALDIHANSTPSSCGVGGQRPDEGTDLILQVDPLFVFQQVHVMHRLSRRSADLGLRSGAIWPIGLTRLQMTL